MVFIWFWYENVNKKWIENVERKENLEIKNSGKDLFSYGFGMEKWIKKELRTWQNGNLEIKNSGKDWFSYGFAKEDWIKMNWGCEKRNIEK